MAEEKGNPQNELAATMIEKCRALEVKEPEETLELIGGATCVILEAIASFWGAPFDEVRDVYTTSLSKATRKS